MPCDQGVLELGDVVLHDLGKSSLHSKVSAKARRSGWAECGCWWAWLSVLPREVLPQEVRGGQGTQAEPLQG